MSSISGLKREGLKREEEEDGCARSEVLCFDMGCLGGNAWGCCLLGVVVEIGRKE